MRNRWLGPSGEETGERLGIEDWQQRSTRQERSLQAGQSSSLSCFSQLRNSSKTQKCTFAGRTFQGLMVINWPAANLLQGEGAAKMTFLFLVDSKIK